MDGYVKTAAVTPDIRVADTAYNGEQVRKAIRQAYGQGARIIVFPELVLTGYTCNDLFAQELLLRGAQEELMRTIEETKGMQALVFVGLPLAKDGRLYNVAAVMGNGCLLGFVPKRHIPNYGEFYEMRHFEPGNEEPEEWTYHGQNVIFGMNQLFVCENMPQLVVAAEICEDLWVPMPPSIRHAMAGATLVVNLSASDELTGKSAYRRELVAGQSARLLCAYVYASAGEGESTTDLVFGGHNLIAENGYILAESAVFENGITYADIDIERLEAERRRVTTFCSEKPKGYSRRIFRLDETNCMMTRYVDPMPFVPQNEATRNERCEEILTIQMMGLKKRLLHTNCKNVVIGISGGLDSTLALLVTAKAFDAIGIPRSGIEAVTMPCFGTTDRTYTNACEMTKRLGATLREIDIKEAVTVHFRDIGHDPSVHDVTYENAQARERTQILMNIANQVGGMVIGTGDMSELALGWATYNGDHMSMYGVNVSVPKTLVRHLVRYYADKCPERRLKDILYDVLDTPVSPELLPPKDGEIAQKTEDIVGPYELHDFFLYYCLRFGFTPGKIFRLAKMAFAETYEPEYIYKWLRTFYWRFFSQQFKRSCLPDGPKVGTVAVSPRGNLRMPSDASVNIWMKELDGLGESL